MKRKQPNYLKALLQRGGELKRGAVTVVDVAHDPWCAHFRGGVCNCKPDITLVVKGPKRGE